MSDLPFDVAEQPTARTVVSVTERKCRRHRWMEELVDEDGGIHRTGSAVCVFCGKVYDPVASRRGRTSARRGKTIQRQRIVGLGGRNLAGNNPNLDGIGEMFAYESKSGGAFPERMWRWLKGIPVNADQVRVLIVTDAPGPGHRARSVVVVSYDDWRDLHGELAGDMRVEE